MQVPLEPSQGARVRCPDRADRVEPGGTGKIKKIQKPTQAHAKSSEKSKEICR
jgi:hypothetical protein